MSHAARNPVYRFFIALNLAYISGLFVFERGTWSGHAWTDLFWLAAGVAATIYSIRAWRNVRDPRVRHGWLWLSLANAFWSLGALIWAWDELALGNYSPSPGLSDLGPLGFGILSVVGMVLLFRPKEKRPWGSTQLLEFAISIGIMAITVGLLLLDPLSVLDNPPRRLLVPLVNSITFSAGVILGISLLSQGRPRASWPACIALLCGLSANLGAHFAYVYAYLFRRYEAGLFIDSLWVMAFSGIALAAYEDWRASQDTESAQPSGDSYRLLSSLSWAFFLGCLGIGLWSYRSLVPGRQLAFLAGAFALNFLIILYLELNWIREMNLRTKLASAVRVRDEFLSVASHEFRTPLTSLAGNLLLFETLDKNHQLKLTDESTLSAPELTQLVRRARRQVDYLFRLVDGLLDARRLAEGKLELLPRHCDLTAIVRSVVDRFAEDLRRAQCEVSLFLPKSAPGFWDELRIEQILANLLSNARKFGAGRPIAILLEQDHDEYQLIVEDRGIGIDARDCERIFEQFGRASTSAHYAGFGLGLYVARQIALAHGGQLLVRSVPRRGSRFILRLPARGAIARAA